MTPALLWLAILVQVMGAACGLLLGSPIGAGVAILCLALCLLLAVAALRQ